MARRTSARSIADRVLDSGEATLLELVDNALTKGVVLSGDLQLGLAGVDLVYVRLSLLLCAADRIFSRRTGSSPHAAGRSPRPRRRSKRGARGRPAR